MGRKSVSIGIEILGERRTGEGNTLRHNESDSFRTDETWYFSDSRITMSLKPVNRNLYLDIS